MELDARDRVMRRLVRRPALHGWRGMWCWCVHGGVPMLRPSLSWHATRCCRLLLRLLLCRRVGRVGQGWMLVRVPYRRMLLLRMLLLLLLLLRQLLLLVRVMGLLWRCLRRVGRRLVP